MKLSDFNKEDLKKMKQACIDTRAKYDGYFFFEKPKDAGWCPLCAFDAINGIGSCSFCPWMIIEDGHCSSNHRFFRQCVYTRRNRLDRWVKLIDEEIRRRG